MTPNTPMTELPAEQYHGHVTRADGSHVALSEGDAKAIWDSVQTRIAKRAERLPTARDALSALIDAEARLRELGWSRGGGLRVKKGDRCAVAQQGSTGLWTGRLDDEGKYVHTGDYVSARQNVFLKPLADLTNDERARMEECDRSEAEAYAAMVSSLPEPTP